MFRGQTPQFARNRYKFSQLTIRLTHHSVAVCEQRGDSIVQLIDDGTFSHLLKLSLLAQSCAKVFQTPKLKLLDCTLAAIQIRRDLANTLLLAKTQQDHFALVFGKCFDGAEESCATFYLFEIRSH